MRPVCFRGRKKMRIPAPQHVFRRCFTAGMESPAKTSYNGEQADRRQRRALDAAPQAPLPCDSKDLFAAAGSPYLNSRPLESKLQI